MFCCFACAILLYGSQSPPVSPVDPDVRAAIHKYDALEFGGVVPLLRKALDRPELSPADRRAALAYLGRTYAVMRKPKLATQAFSRLLQLDPSFAIDDFESPLIREAFADARAKIQPAPAPAVPPLPPVTPPPAEIRTLPPSPVDPPRGEDSFWDAKTIGLFGGVAAAVIAGTILVVLEPWKANPAEPGSLGRWRLP